MKKITILTVFLIGCASFSQSQISAKAPPATDPGDPELETNPYPTFTDVQCYDLMKARDGWLFAAKLLGGLGTASAITTPLPQWNDGARWGFGAGAAALTVGGVASLWVGENKSKEFERFCEVK